MNKRILTVLILIIIPLCLFADSEELTSIGIGYENNFEMSGSTNYSMNSIAVVGSAYKFWNESDIGFFIADSIMFPLELNNDGITYKFEFVLGPGIRKNLFSNVFFCYAVGPSFSFLTIKDSGYSLHSYTMGIGTDASVKYKIGDSFGLSIGCMASLLLYQYESGNYGSVYFSGRTGDFLGLDIRPYISGTFNITRT